MAVEPVVAPPPGNPRFPLVDSLRGIACLLVIGSHAVHVSGAYKHYWFGTYTEHMLWVVAMFFMISAFLLYRPFVAARINATDTSPSVADYAWRRFLRVVPGYWVALAVLWVTVGMPHMGQWWPHYFTLTQVYGSERQMLGGDSPAWTLSCEIIFYAALPVIVIAMRRFASGNTPRQRLESELATVGLLVLAGLSFRLLVPDLAQRGLNRTFLATVDWFALGMGLAAVSAYLAPRRRQPTWVVWIRREPLLPWLAALLCFLLVAPLHTGADFFLVRGRASAGEDLASHALYGAIALLIMLPAVFGDGAGGLPRRLLALRPLKWLGMVAYGVYLYHFPILVQLWEGGGSRTGGANWLGLLLSTAAVAIAAGAASYYLVERPFLRYKNRRPAGLRRAPRRAVAWALPAPSDSPTAKGGLAAAPRAPNQGGWKLSAAGRPARGREGSPGRGRARGGSS